jgi:DNA-binding transcriptional LysR family regulator
LQQGVLRLTSPSVFGRGQVTPLVASYLDAYPGIQIVLVLTNSNLNLIAQGFDVAIRLGPLAD